MTAANFKSAVETFSSIPEGAEAWQSAHEAMVRAAWAWADGLADGRSADAEFPTMAAAARAFQALDKRVKDVREAHARSAAMLPANVRVVSNASGLEVIERELDEAHEGFYFATLDTADQLWSNG